MNRRAVIKHLVVVSAGATIIPSCIQPEKALFPLKKIALSSADQELISVLTETIIPRTANFPGANDLKLHEFLLTMVDDCAKPADQQTFLRGLRNFEEKFKKNSKSSFVSTGNNQRMGFLKEIERTQDSQDDIYKFYRMVKQYTLQGFTSSKQYLTDIKKFSLVPGSRFKGCVPIKGVAGNKKV
jgi:hypothetical protein